MQLDVNRNILKTPQRTIGSFSVNCSRLFYSCEDAVREVIGQPVAQWKIQNQTAIPAGTYKVIMSFSPHFNRILPELLDVLGYSGVRIHNGNTEADTDGCILIGLTYFNGGVQNSVAALNQFLPIIEAAWSRNEPIQITVG